MQPLLESIKMSRTRYEQELKANEQVRSKSKEEIQGKNELLTVESEIKKLEKGIEVADKAISDGSSKLERHLVTTPFDPEKLQSDSALIKMGVQKRKN